jgi:hypothetical protein
VTTPLVVLPTFSGLPRWFRCQLVDVLPRVDSPSQDRAAGSARHAFFQRITELLGSVAVDPCPVVDGANEPWTLDRAREAALAEAPPEYQTQLAAIPVDSPAFRFYRVAPEVALALDLETGAGRELGRGLERDYSTASPTELVGTIDRLGFIGEDGLYVGDYKGRSHRCAPEKDPQFLAAALAAARAYGRNWAEIEVVYTIGDLVLTKKGRVDLLDLDSFEQRLLDRRDLAAKNQAAIAADPMALPEGELGDHCSYCDRLPYCPAKMMLARAVLGGEPHEELGAIVKVGAAYLTTESAPRLHALVKQAEGILERVKEALADYARQTPFQLADGTGRWYGVPPDATTRELLDGKKVRDVLVELFGPEAGAAGVKVEATLGGIEKATKAYLAANPTLSKRGAIKEHTEKAEKLLAERGLLRTIAGGQVKIHKREA